MKAVNLLPQKHRPAAPTGERQGSAWIVLGILAVLLGCVVMYVLTGNSINGQKEQVAQAEKEKAEAEARTQTLQPYGDFSSVAQTRLSSVTQQAQSRIDWERLVRELAHVLPEGTWLTSSDAAVDASKLQGGAQEGLAGPALHLVGCAHKQRDVATALVRLRRLSGATDVQLTESTKGDDEQGGGAGAVAGAESSPEDCGSKDGQPNYKFDVTVTFDAAAASNAAGVDDGGDTNIPARLGGGS